MFDLQAAYMLTWSFGTLTIFSKDIKHSLLKYKRLEFSNDEVARELEVGQDDDGDGFGDDNCMQDIIPERE